MIQINNNNFYSISEINEFISGIFTNIEQFKNIGLVGEVSNFKGPNRSGHIYFSLKDEKSVIPAVIFKYNALSIDTEFQDGDQILVVGKLSCYATGGYYQIVINKVFPYGKGNILLKRERLKQKLLKEGYFDVAHKKPLPEYPFKIAIITGLNSAASLDLKVNLNRRWPIGEVFEFNPLVQGKEAAKDIIAKLKEAEAIKPDIIIIGRGGGAVEDLSAFDDEELVKAIYHSNIPIISAVGHEINQSFSDLVSDRYASTPTGAAELATPLLDDVIEDISQLFSNIISIAKSKIDTLSNKVNSIKKSGNITNINLIIKNYLDKIKQLNETIKTNYINVLKMLQSKVEKYKALCNSNSPLNILNKGYSITYKDKKIVSSVKDVKTGDNLVIKLKDGDINVEVK